MSFATTPGDDRIRVLIVDDHPATRFGLRALLTAEPRVAFVGEVQHSEEWEATLLEKRPAVVLLDLIMHRRKVGFDVCRRMKKIDPALKVILYSGQMAESDWPEVEDCGADGFLDKTDQPRDLVAAISQVVDGHFALSPRLVRPAWKAYVQAKRWVEQGSRVGADLDVAFMESLAAGKSNKEISQATGVPEGTVKNRLTVLFKRFGVSGREAAARAWRRHAAGQGGG